jgi:hypothetical protein
MVHYEDFAYNQLLLDIYIVFLYCFLEKIVI